MRRLLVILMFIAFGVACCPGNGAATDTFFRSVGVKFGQSATATENYFHQYEVSAVGRLPWELRAPCGWGIVTLIDLSAGALRGEGETGFIGSAGPALSFGKKGFPLEIDAGVSAAVISRDSFGNRDLNGNLQFISHVGVDWRFGRKFGIGYRFQHLSNAGLYGGPNPGLNMHLLGLNWYFGE
jgi:hypothetical protein